MSRKKMKKGAKVAAKKMSAKVPSKMKNVSHTEMMEKDFRAAPAKIAAQHRKDLAASKQQEKKLAAEIKKAQMLRKTMVSKCDALAKAKPVAKKQFEAAKKAVAGWDKAISDLSKQLEQAKKWNAMCSQKHALFTMLAKQLPSMEKQFAMKSTMKSKKPAKPRVKMQKKSKAESHMPTMSEHSVTEEMPMTASTNDSITLES